MEKMMKLYFEVESNNPTLSQEKRKVLEDFLFSCIANTRQYIHVELDDMKSNKYLIYDYTYLRGEGNLDKVIVQMEPVDRYLPIYKTIIGVNDARD